ncbi:WD40 repeat domain-containing protein [Streptomyces sp. RGM 3693]|uniref:WD40 repeat domain-containing protein n=1 Tax=Streptomyces sp. RGM 3693 TaxID=3413284 RepID=UPI003D2C0E9C
MTTARPTPVPTPAPVPAPDMAAWPPLDDRRADAGRALLDWAATTDGSLPRLCVLRGARGSGKSHLLAWLLVGSHADRRTTAHATVPAAGLITDAVAWEMSRQLGYGPLPPHRLLDRVAADERPLLLLVPDLHLAGRGASGDGPAGPRQIVDELLVPLLRLPHVRAVAETGTTDLLADEVAAPWAIDLGDAPYAGTTPPAATAPGDAPPADFASLDATVPRTAAGRPIWDQAPPSAREHILDAALGTDDGGSAARALLADPGYLVHGSPTAITAALRDSTTVTPAGLRAIWNRAAPHLSTAADDAPERAALLHAAALTTSPTLTEYLRPLAQAHPWTASWARHDVPVAAHCLLPGKDGSLLVADPLGRLCLHDPTTGERTGVLPSPATLRPYGIAAADPDTVLLFDESGPLCPLTPDDEGMAATVLGHLAAHHGEAALTSAPSRPTALGSCGRTGTAVVGDASGAVHLWSLAEYRPLPHTRRVHSAPVTATACLRLPEDDLTFVFSAALDGTIRLWETSGDPMEAPVDRRPALVTALAAADTPVGPVLAAAWNDAELHLWHLADGAVHTLPLLHRCNTLALSPSGRLTLGGPDGLHCLQLDLDRLWP